MRGTKIQKEEKLMVLQSGHSSIGLVDDQIMQLNYKSSQESEAWPGSPSSLLPKNLSHLDCARHLDCNISLVLHGPF